jgi:hypothetical protein
MRPRIRSVAKPPINISCECGERQDVAYGERWKCEQCGRSWNTAQIPAEEYEHLLRSVRRHKLEILGLGLLVAAVLIPLIAFVSARFIAVAPLLMALWLFVVLPRWRFRYRRTAREAPRWQLHPE